MHAFAQDAISLIAAWAGAGPASLGLACLLLSFSTYGMREILAGYLAYLLDPRLPAARARACVLMLTRSLFLTGLFLLLLAAVERLAQWTACCMGIHSKADCRSRGPVPCGRVVRPVA